MTALRQRLIEDLRPRNFSRDTVEAYVRAVAHFARHYRRSPEHRVAAATVLLRINRGTGGIRPRRQARMLGRKK